MQLVVSFLGGTYFFQFAELSGGLSALYVGGLFLLVGDVPVFLADARGRHRVGGSAQEVPEVFALASGAFCRGMRRDLFGLVNSALVHLVAVFPVFSGGIRLRHSVLSSFHLANGLEVV